MQTAIQAPETKGYIKVIASGTFSLDEVDEMFSDITTSPGWSPGMPIMIDVTHLETKGIYSLDIEDVAATVAGLSGHFGHSRMALLIAGEMQYGLAMKFQSVIQSRSTTAVEAFLDERRAIDWLLIEQ